MTAERKFEATGTCTEGCVVDSFTTRGEDPTERYSVPVPHTSGPCKGKGKVMYTIAEVSEN